MVFCISLQQMKQEFGCINKRSVCVKMEVVLKKVLLRCFKGMIYKFL